MDYIILSALIGFGLLRLVITYDIFCNWSKNWAKRMQAYPENMQIDLDHTEVLGAMLGFHIRAHGVDCQQLYSLGLMQHVGNTVGEEVETGWAHMNLAASSIREMGPGHLHEVLNDHSGGWNFQKIITFSMWCLISRSFTDILSRDSFLQAVQAILLHEHQTSRALCEI
jgi:hypothetical protein